jgi:1,4-alpha-glucan branching enzyme
MERKKNVKKGQMSDNITEKNVLFEFCSPDAQEIFLAGDFNNWDTHSNPLKKDRKGTWKITLSLKPGRYEYRFVSNGNWENDPSCSCCVPNDFGSENCVKIVE